MASYQRLATVASCALDQWALDFEGNLRRTRESIAAARAAGATYRLGPELELTGYGCEDHFLELDTERHAWELVAELLAGDDTVGMVVDVGLPVTHCGVRYNCRALLLDRGVLLLRPKVAMADDGNYREARFFTAWRRGRPLESHQLPGCVHAACGQETAPFGDAAVRFADAVAAAETCEELFTPDAPHVSLALAGVELFANGSGSHHQLRKLDRRLELILGATARCGGAYMYANQRGCDGGRLYFDGCACVALNGALVAQGEQFAVEEVEVNVATVDLDAVVSFRAAFKSMQEQAAGAPEVNEVLVPGFRLCGPPGAGQLLRAPSEPRQPRLHTPEEEIARGPACWLWDYLRRSGAGGYLLPLSGGADSSSTAAIVGSMCQMAVAAARGGDAGTAAAVRRLAGLGGRDPLPDARALAGCVFSTVYLGTENSSEETRSRSERLASEVGAQHLEVRIDTVVSAVVALFGAATGRTPSFKARGGTEAENLALQNIQARLRMVVAYLLAQLLPWVRGKAGFMLVLGSANVDEGLRGYMTKYDCSSADVNPIGGISKRDLRSFLRWGAANLGYPSLAEVEAAPPSAELEPLAADGAVAQTDEEDMGMTYDDLTQYGTLRKVARHGPVSMFLALLRVWRHLSPSEVAAKVKRFFFLHAANRHKMTTLTPSYHAENYSPDDNRFDLRPFLYNVRWPWQFRKIDELAAQAEGEAQGAGKRKGKGPGR